LPAAREGIHAEVQGVPGRVRGVSRRAPGDEAGGGDRGCRRRHRRPHHHSPMPPPRFSEATLVKELEENGIGRPSTYASIIATIEAREYMEKREGKLYPTELGFVVTDLLVGPFQDIMNVEYTAGMEAELDEVGGGK